MAPPHKKSAAGKASAASASKATISRERRVASNKPRERPSSSKAVGLSRAPRKRKAVELRSDDEETDESEASDHIPKAPVLHERISDLPKARYQKWSPLTDKIRDDVRGIMRAAEAPVLMMLRREAARAEAQHAIQDLIRILLDASEKINAPRVGKNMTLDYNDLVHKTADLEAVLEPTLHHNAELEKELEQQKAMLANDERELKILQKNAKSQEKVRADQLRTLPRTLRMVPQSRSDNADSIGMSLSSDLQGALSYDPSKDRELRPITLQLQQHLYSMETNASALGDIPECIAHGRAAVQAVLERGAPKLYNKVALDL